MEEKIKNPLVSIIMPLYNAEKYVGEAIESVLAQTYTNWELIIVNDGSTDNSLIVAKKFESEKIKVYSQVNSGASVARNYGYSQSKGEFIKFFDADDILSKNMFEVQIESLANDKDSICISSWGRFYADDITTFKMVQQNLKQSYNPLDWILWSWKDAQPMTQPGMILIPRNVISKAGIWNKKLSLIDDFEFFTRVILSCEKIIHSEKSILYYRSGLPNALSGQKSRKAVESAFLSIELGTERFLMAENSKLTRLCCANLWQGFIYEFYYQQPDLAKKAETKIKELGGSNLEFPSGKITKIISKFLGWKAAKWIREKNNK